MYFEFLLFLGNGLCFFFWFSCFWCFEWRFLVFFREIILCWVFSCFGLKLVIFYIVLGGVCFFEGRGLLICKIKLILIKKIGGKEL